MNRSFCTSYAPTLELSTDLYLRVMIGLVFIFVEDIDSMAD